MNINEIKTLLNPEQTKKFELWDEANRTYYGSGDGEVIMSDPEFDDLTEELINFGIDDLTKFVKSSIYRVKNEPSDIVAKNSYGNDLDSEDEDLEAELEHSDHVMISLDKIKYKNITSITDIKQFFTKQQEIIKATDKRLFIGAKFDGTSLKLTCNFEVTNQPKIIRILSRGGIDVTEKMINVKGIANSLNYRKHTITGELVIDKKLFEKKYSILNSGDYENARNFVGTLIKMGIEKITDEILNDLVFIPFTDGLNPINDSVWKEISFDELVGIQNYINFYKSENFPYLCDGVVLAMNEPTDVRRVKNNYPLNMVAVKFPSERAKTIVKDMTWTQKKSGKLTPILEVEPTRLDGSTITYANGYNYQKLLENGIGIGSVVDVTKSGDIIPVVIKVHKKSTNIKMPNVEYVREGKHLVAKDLTESIKYKFILAIKILNIDNVGDIIAEKIGEIPSINWDILNIFNSANMPDICQALGGGVVWEKFRDEISNKKTITLDRLINLLQFDGVGPIISVKVAFIILGDRTQSKNISSDILRNVAGGEGFKRIQKAIHILKGFGVSVIKPININSDENITFEMSGEPSGCGLNMTKAEFVLKLKEKYPNSIHTSLTKNTNYLIVDTLRASTSKANKARRYNVNIVTYKEALDGKLNK